jgi:CDP-diacylglycerol--serine O-phosphatidyltransferase
MPPHIPRPRIALVQLLPNAMTLGAICAGVTSMRMAMDGRFDLAVALLALAALLDGIDGWIARALKSESLIGAELDSLADVVNFGVAPAILLYFFSLWQAPVAGWAAALAYVACCALRLARFNARDRVAPPAERAYFTGVPSPAGALLALAPVLLAQSAVAIVLPAPAVALWLGAVGLLMVSRIPTFSLKVRVPPAVARLALGTVAALAVGLAWDPWTTLLVADAVYLAGIVAAQIVRHRSSPS